MDGNSLKSAPSQAVAEGGAVTLKRERNEASRVGEKQQQEQQRRAANETADDETAAGANASKV